MPITNFDKFKLLLPMTGDNNGTAFRDFSYQRIITTSFAGNPAAITTTAQSKFAAYGSCGQFGENTAGQACPRLNYDFTGATVGTGSFTIGGWCRMADVSSTAFLFDFFPSTSAFTARDPASSKFLCYYRGASNAIAFLHNTTRLDGTTAATNNTWFHMEFSRDSDGTVRGFMNGVKEIEQSGITNNFSNAFASVGGIIDTTNYKSRWFQDVYYIRGVALHTANFTPPNRMTQRTLTRASIGADSHQYDRALLFDWNGSPADLGPLVDRGAPRANGGFLIPDSEGDFVQTGLNDVEYGVVFIKDGCGPICRGPVEVDPDA